MCQTEEDRITLTMTRREYAALHLALGFAVGMAKRRNEPELENTIQELANSLHRAAGKT